MLLVISCVFVKQETGREQKSKNICEGISPLYAFVQPKENDESLEF